MVTRCVRSAVTDASQLTPQLLKAALLHHLNELLKPIQDEFAASKEWQDIEEQAYPTEKVVKKEKKPKDKGDPTKRAAAAAAAATRKGVVAQPDGHVEGPGAQKLNTGVSEAEMKKLQVAES